MAVRLTTGKFIIFRSIAILTTVEASSVFKVLKQQAAHSCTKHLLPFVFDRHRATIA